MRRWLTAVPLALAAFLPLSAAPAKADTHEMIHQAFSAAEVMAEGWANRAVDRAQDYAAAAHVAILAELERDHLGTSPPAPRPPGGGPTTPS